MAKVRTYDPFFGLEFVEESTWGTNPNTGFLRVPFQSEDFHVEDDVFPDSEEFAALGALLGVDKGRRIVRGSLTVEPQYNGIWFWTMFGGTCFSHEDRVANDDIVATGTQTDLHTHIFTRSLTLPVGGTFRVWKAGTQATASEYYDIITGCLATGWRWEQPEGDRATVTIDFIGKAITSTASTVAPGLTALSSGFKFKAVDFDSSVRTGAQMLFGNTLTALNISGFTITSELSVEPGTGFLTSLLTLDKPGVVANRSLTLDITSVLESDYAAAQKPWTELFASTQSRCVIVYESGDSTGVPTATPQDYKVRFDFPLLEWVDVRYGASQAGEIPFTAQARGLFGPLSNLGSWNDHAFPPGGSTDLRVLCQVANSDIAAKFTDLGDSS